MENSSMMALDDAFFTLSNQSHDAFNLQYAYENAKYISEAFAGVNPNLSTSWAKAAEFFEKISVAVSDMCQEVAVDVKKFAYAAYYSEQTAAQVVEEANNAAASILDRLGL